MPSVARHRIGFGWRLFLAILVTLIAIGALGYFLMAGQLRETQISDYAGAQRADVRSFETIARQASTRASAVAQIDELLNAIALRPGTLETLLMDPDSTVVASGTDAVDRHAGTPTRGSQRRSRAGTSYAGLEGDPDAATRATSSSSRRSTCSAAATPSRSRYDHRVLDARSARRPPRHSG